jgi:hypothetical protein
MEWLETGCELDFACSKFPLFLTVFYIVNGEFMQETMMYVTQGT